MPRKIIISAGCLLLLPISAFAGVQDYQIVRLIAMKSECSRTTLVRTELGEGKLRFHAECRNVSHYPDGVNVVCSDETDERSCTIQTEAKKFDHLKLLQAE